uniref:UPAR/Ly6 domain-containing protein n=1 Tax=Oryzias latipes TaxID=8090 RepID=H2N1W1_ORYLA
RKKTFLITLICLLYLILSSTRKSFFFFKENYQKKATCFFHKSHQCGITFCLKAGGSKIMDQNEKGFPLSEECGEASVNFGLSKTWINTQCCNSNLCNTHKTTNGRQRFTCDGLTCNKTLDCEGNDDYCFTASGETSVLILFRRKMILKRNHNHLNFCNSAVTASTGLQLVVVALVSLTLFS